MIVYQVAINLPSFTFITVQWVPSFIQFVPVITLITIRSRMLFGGVVMGTGIGLLRTTLFPVEERIVVEGFDDSKTDGKECRQHLLFGQWDHYDRGSDLWLEGVICFTLWLPSSYRVGNGCCLYQQKRMRRRDRNESAECHYWKDSLVELTIIHNAEGT